MIDPVFAALSRQQTDTPTATTASSASALSAAATAIINKLKESCIADPTKVGAAVLAGFPDIVQFIPDNIVTQSTEHLVARFCEAHQSEKRLSILFNLTQIARSILPLV